MSDELRPIPIDTEGFDISLVEVIIDGKPSGFAVRGPDGAEYSAADLADALGLIAEIKKRIIEDQKIKRSPPGPRR